MSGAPVTPASVQVPGEHDAPVVVDFGVHALRVAYVSRRSVGKLPASWSRPGVYALLGPLGAAPAAQVYVGKAVKLRDRLIRHHSKEPMPWWRAIAVARDTTDGFNSAEIAHFQARRETE